VYRVVMLLVSLYSCYGLDLAAYDSVVNLLDIRSQGPSCTKQHDAQMHPRVGSDANSQSRFIWPRPYVP
jgi:hypothetical protein